MKKMVICSCVMFTSLCQFFLNRRKRLQAKKRLQVLQRLERFTVSE